jgi:hypothetical protein
MIKLGGIEEVREDRFMHGADIVIGEMILLIDIPVFTWDILLGEMEIIF